MTRILSTVCAMIGASAIAAGGYLAVTRPAAVTDGESLQQLATSSCRCERRVGAGGKSACWAAFDKKLPPAKSSEGFTSCYPISEQTRCGGAGGIIEVSPGSYRSDEGPCAVTGYDYMPSDGGHVLLCLKEEAAMVEQAWSREIPFNPTGEIRTPVADKMARDLAAGRPITPLDGQTQCAGS